MQSVTVSALTADALTPIIDFNIVTVHVNVVVGVVEYGGWPGIARIAGHVVG